MSKKVIILCLALLNTAFSYATEVTPNNTKLVEESISLAEDITALIVACKKDKESIAAIVKKMVLDTVELTETIIKNRKAKKTNRALSIEHFNFNDIAADPLELSLTTIVNLVNQALEKQME